jgi:hypothetical protein
MLMWMEQYPILDSSNWFVNAKILQTDLCGTKS